MIIASVSNKKIAQKLYEEFIVKPKVSRFTSDDSHFYVDIATSADSPTKDISSSGTIGLSDFPLYNTDGTIYKDTRLELVGAYHTRFSNFQNMLFHTAFHIVTEKWLCQPGVFLEDVLVKFGYVGDMRHFAFEEPFIWKDFHTLKLEDKKVSWLQAIPVSEAEMKYAKKTSLRELGKRFDELGTDIFDLDRTSIF